MYFTVKQLVICYFHYIKQLATVSYYSRNVIGKSRGEGGGVEFNFREHMILGCIRNVNQLKFYLYNILDTECLMPKKLEEIAYQASDKVYGKEDTGPYECLR
jgi:hypothetical protein